MKLSKKSYLEYQASLFGACFVSFGLGALFGGYFDTTVLYILIIVGVAMHGWGMYRMYKK